jgi:putative phosphoribosyl transferase
MLAAIRSVRRGDPAHLVVVPVPVAPQPTCEALRNRVDELICLLTPDPFFAVGVYYVDFRPIADEEVQRLLAERAR